MNQDPKEPPRKFPPSQWYPISSSKVHIKTLLRVGDFHYQYPNQPLAGAEAVMPAPLLALSFQSHTLPILHVTLNN